MTTIRARDLWRLPALISWSRLLFAAVFPLLVARPLLAVGLLCAAGLSDVLDGWVARRYGLVTAAGAILDPITDKLFVLSVALSLWAAGRLTPLMILLLATREVAELPLVLWYAFSHRARAARVETPMANLGGKLATVVQFLVVAWALFEPSHLAAGVVLAAIAGALAALGYWRRALRLGHAKLAAKPGAPLA